MSRSRLIVLVLGVWAVYGLFLSLQTYFAFLGKPQELSLGAAFFSQFYGAAVFAAGTFWAIWFSRRCRIERKNWPSRLAIHIGHSVLFAVVLGAAHAVIDVVWFFRDPWTAIDYLRSMLFVADSEITTYWAVVFVTHTFDSYASLHSVELRASKLETQLAHARFDLLKAQLHPHFLFNALNTISAVIHEDVQAADRMIASLGQFLHATLKQGHTPEVTLEEEVELLECYLEIQRVRFAGRLHVEVDVPSALRDCRVPLLVLQPLVENAIKHGIASDADAGRVVVRARGEGGLLTLTVSDNGGQSPARETNAGHGVGLTNTRSRLQHLYGDVHALHATQTAEGFVVEMRIPIRTGAQNAKDGGLPLQPAVLGDAV